MDNCVIPQGYKATALGIIPQEWEVRPLNYFGAICSGGTPDTEVAEYWNGDIAWCTPSDITKLDTKYIESTEVKITAKGLKESSASLLPPRSIVVCTRATIGNAAICNTEIATNQGFKNIIPNEKTNPEWLYYIIIYSKPRLVRLGCGSTFLEVSKKDFSRFKIAVPPLAEQRKIAEVLGVWDEAIEKQARLIEKLALRKRALMQRLLSAKLRLPGFSEPWKKVNYSDILKEVRRTLIWDENELYDLISVRRRSGGVFHRESLYGHEIKTKTLRPALEGDFLISKMQIVHGASGVVPKQLSGMKISGSYIALIAKDPKELNINYFNLWSQMPLFYHQTFVSSYGVHIEKMTFDLDAFMSLSMNLPPIEEQNRIVEVISTATNEIELGKEKLERLRRQKRGLMQQLLTGKKRVNY
ncbi:restriction endonuclease subunit S [uncultured Alistipes sp.]|uniref:restriction endonuclease subunit S n=1 Tax=uncultured Alistipes sp. TaxID=538949 RepID=UPI002621860F|nr:restriction endonuclease subunit S [uncultured Alistipes sp.]